MSMHAPHPHALPSASRFESALLRPLSSLRPCLFPAPLPCVKGAGKVPGFPREFREDSGGDSPTYTSTTRKWTSLLHHPRPHPPSALLSRPGPRIHPPSILQPWRRRWRSRTGRRRSRTRRSRRMSAPATSSRRVVRPVRAHAPTMHPACRRQAGLTMRAAWDVCALGGNAAVADAVRTSLGPRGMDKMVKEPRRSRRGCG